MTITRSHLDLAESRRGIGVARPSEVVRWESQIAVNRRDLVAAGARRRVAEIELNRLLDRPLDEAFETAGIDPNDPALLTPPSTLDTYAGNPAAFERFLEFMAAEGLAHAPELRQIDAAIDAQERAVLAARRAWTPTVVAQGDIVGIGRSDIETTALPFALPPMRAFTWTVGVSATLPLFDGGTRRANRSRAERELDELRLSRRAAADRVEQRIRSALHLAGASHVGIDLAAEAARAARRNLELVTDAYGEGSASILDLIDAQQTALVARHLEANAVYEYLIDLMDVHRAMGRFGFFMEPPDIVGFTARLRDFYRARERCQPDATPSKSTGGSCR